MTPVACFSREQEIKHLSHSQIDRIRIRRQQRRLNLKVEENILSNVLEIRRIDCQAVLCPVGACSNVDSWKKKRNEFEFSVSQRKLALKLLYLLHCRAESKRNPRD